MDVPQLIQQKLIELRLEQRDLADAVERLVPRDDRYRHRHGSVGKWPKDG